MIDKCVHVAKREREAAARIEPSSTTHHFDLCADCYYIWNNDRQPDPANSIAYNVYGSSDRATPKPWKLLNDKPIPPTDSGKVQYRVEANRLPPPTEPYYFYVVTLSAIGLETPSEICEVEARNGTIEIDRLQ